LNEEVAKLQRSEKTLADRIEKRDKKLASAHERMEVLKQAIEARKTEAAERKAQLTALTASQKAAQLKVSQLEQGIGDLRAELAEKNESIKQLKAHGKQQAVDIKALEGDLRRQGAKPRTAERDDLKEITGIGPVLERKLKQRGVTTFRQIAELTPSAIESLAEKVGTTPQKIRKDRWVSRARILAKAKVARS
jgi:predicted flap endonuclease-1-like 5' DNA nuclease